MADHDPALAIRKMADHDLALAIRQAVLMALDALERWMMARGWWDGPRTAELRKMVKGRA